MKRAILFICILAISLTVICIPSFAVSVDSFDVLYYDSPDTSLIGGPYQGVTFADTGSGYRNVFKIYNDVNAYFFLYGASYYPCFVVPIDDFYLNQSSTYIFGRWNPKSGSAITKQQLTTNSELNLAYCVYTNYGNSNYTTYAIHFDSLSDGLLAVRNYIDNLPSYDKNAHVDEFIANTLISMGFTFNSGSDALSVASDAWNWCTDENNLNSIDRVVRAWDIDNFVSYSNAQSNNFENWYLGYRVNDAVTNGLRAYIFYNYDGDRNSGTLGNVSVRYNASYQALLKNTEPVSNTFYPAETITYTNGEYLTSNGYSLDQFAYTPPDVRQFLGSPPASILPLPDSPNGTGVITDENGDTVYNIDIEFPSLDWLGRALQAIADAIRSLIDNVSNLLSKIIDSLTKLFGDAFEGLSSFGEGIVEWIQLIVESIHDLMSEYFPSDLTAILFAFLCLNVGVGLIKFILRSH